jgi:DNA-binding XRE family transcriptional regulator
MIYKNRVKEIRENRKMLQLELAARAKLAHATLNKLERGWTVCTLETAEKIAAALDCEVTDLFGDQKLKSKSVTVNQGDEIWPVNWFWILSGTLEDHS